MDEIIGYKFGDFRIDLATRQLHRHAEEIPIKPRLFELLLFLVVHQGEVLLREEIIDHVWGDQSIEDGNLSLSIHLLRRIIDEQEPSRILTVPTRGYVFADEVRPLKATDPPELHEPTTSAALPAGSATLPSDESEAVLPTPPERPVDRPGRRGLRRLRRFGLLALAGVPVLFLLGSYLIFRSPIRQLTILSNYSISSRTLDPEFSPDGRLLAFSSYGETGGNEDIYLKTVDQDQRIRVTTHPDADRSPIWSPDGKQLAFLRWSSTDHLLARVIMLDLKSRVEREVGRSRGALGWMPDSERLMVSDLEPAANGRSASTVLYQISIDQPGRRQLTYASTPGTVDSLPRGVSDGESIAFLRAAGERGGEIFLLDLLTGRMVQVTQEGGAITFFRWGGREAGLYFVSNRSGSSRLWHIQLKSLLTRIYGNSGTPRLVDQMPYHLDQFAISPTRPLLTYARQLRLDQAWIFDISSRGEIGPQNGCILQDARIDDAPQLSPDGKRVAFISARSGGEEIWIGSSRCGELKQLTSFNGGGVRHPRWSPDGLALVFERLIDGQSDIFTIGLDGRGARRLTSSRVIEAGPSWSSDGRSIYYTTILDGREQIVRLPVDGGEPQPIVATGGRNPVEAVDGRTLYFTRDGFLCAVPLDATEKESLARVPPGLRELRLGQNWQIGADGIYFLSETITSALALERADLTARSEAVKIDRLALIGGVRAAGNAGIGLAANQKYLSIILTQGLVGDLTTVEGWRVRPFSEYMIDLLHLEELLNPKSSIKDNLGR